MEDLRDRNIEFDASNSLIFFNKYFQLVSKTFDQIKLNDLEAIINLIMKTREQGSMIYSMGNGGSSAIAEHLVCDFTKGCFLNNTKLKSISLNSNISLLTAVANDFSYDDVFKKQLEMYVEKNDIVIAITSSGNSQNVISALRYLNEKGIKSISFTGFDGGEVKDLSTYNIHVPVNNYGIIEDVHQSLMHIIAQYLYLSQKTADQANEPNSKST